ncbi:hypothetical protein [Lactococcus petauri]|uniref:Uncharacterized protein n=1 Tax=Lactococcus petauri TaxID=1940789 RepID=A0A252CA42_9LACT|nr:hypothetical protein [Lactococcus petauri]OUK01655.1 hypothetical protein BZZ03_11675 [Lactococcus petauri]
MKKNQLGRIVVRSMVISEEDEPNRKNYISEGVIECDVFDYECFTKLLGIKKQELIELNSFIHTIICPYLNNSQWVYGNYENFLISHDLVAGTQQAKQYSLEYLLKICKSYLKPETIYHLFSEEGKEIFLEQVLPIVFVPHLMRTLPESTKSAIENFKDYQLGLTMGLYSSYQGWLKQKNISNS